VNEYRLRPLGVTTTMPSPGNGNGSRYFKSFPPLAAYASGARATHGSANPVPAAIPYRNKRRRVIPVMCSSRMLPTDPKIWLQLRLIRKFKEESNLYPAWALSR
jgi:hypothetical protein